MFLLEQALGSLPPQLRLTWCRQAVVAVAVVVAVAAVLMAGVYLVALVVAVSPLAVSLWPFTHGLYSRCLFALGTLRTHSFELVSCRAHCRSKQVLRSVAQPMCSQHSGGIPARGSHARV